MKRYIPILTVTVLCLLIAAASAPAGGCAQRRKAAKSVVTKDMTYGMGYVAGKTGEDHRLQPLLMDMIQPAGGRNTAHPAALLIHGGGFEHGSKEDERLRVVADRLVEAGYVCFLINYRLTEHFPPAPPPHGDVLSKTIHAAAVDAKTALRFVRAHARKYRINPKKIALIGESAGAMTALAAGLSPGDAFTKDGEAYPVPEENHPREEARAEAIVNLWGSADFFLEYFSAQSPPIMTVHGGKDFRVGVSLMPALNIDEQCKKFGIPHVYYPFPEAGHGVWDAVVYEKPLPELIVEFLNTYMVKRN